MGLPFDDAGSVPPAPRAYSTCIRPQIAALQAGHHFGSAGDLICDTPSAPGTDGISSAQVAALSAGDHSRITGLVPVPVDRTTVFISPS